ncbi:MFS transporter [Nocardioides sp. R1-1]|uniref:MFS transporter n=1 Tax=Nocardioides sp. R1-1 TaxID=3383502 RepID=UPI0038D0DC04
MTSTLTRARVRIPVVVVGFVLVLVDGFDSATISVVVPRLAADWGVAPSAFTYPIAATNAGVALGYVAAGWVCVRLGERRALQGGLLLAMVGSALSALVLPTESMTLLTAARILTGLGIGVVLPTAIGITTSLNPARHKQRIAVVVTLGLASGIAVGGAVGRPVLRGWGADGMYWIAAVATLLSMVLAAAVLGRAPARTEEAAVEEAPSAEVRALLAPVYRTTTLLLWTFSFLVFITSYMLTSWIPTILVSYGFSVSDAPIGLTFLSVGGVLGGLTLIALTLRLGIARAMVVVAVVGLVFLVLLGTLEASGRPLLLLVLGAGLGVVACQIGQLTMAVSVYSAALRTTGVGLAAAVGRVGSVVGPAIGGVLIGAHLAPTTVMLLAAVPVLVALGCACLLAFSGVRPGTGRAALLPDAGRDGAQ